MAPALVIVFLLVLLGVAGFFAWKRYRPLGLQTTTVTPPTSSEVTQPESAPTPTQEAAPAPAPPTSEAAPAPPLTTEPVPNVAARPTPSTVRTPASAKPPRTQIQTRPEVPGAKASMPPAAAPLSMPPPAATLEPAATQPVPPARTAPSVPQVTKPEPAAPSVPVQPPAPAAYTGPSSGDLIWSGKLEKNGTITIQGSSSSSGTLRGRFPGVPVLIQIQPTDLGVAEVPSPQNGWDKIVLRSRVNRLSVVTIHWTVIK